MSKKSLAELHKHISTETAGPNGFATVKMTDELKQLATEKKVELHPDGPNAEGMIAVKAASAAPVTPTSEMIAPAEVAKPKLETVYLKPSTAKSAQGRRENVWTATLLAMEVNQSFVVATSAAFPDPLKKFTGVIGGLMRKLSVADPSGKTKLNRKKEPVPAKVPTKKFSIRTVTKGEKYPDGYEEQETGVRIYRTA